MGSSPEELIESWALLDVDLALVANKAGATRLGFALLLKFYEIEGRFRCDRSELTAGAVAYVAKLVNVDHEAFDEYSWSSRTLDFHWT